MVVKKAGRGSGKSDIATEKQRAWAVTIIFLVASGISGYVLFSFGSTAVAKEFSSLAIGSINTRDQFTNGSWFRYDSGGNQYFEVGQRMYFVTQIVNVTTAGNPINGDPLVFQKIGDAKWYVWSIKVYWMDGTEAKSLYGKNNTGYFNWDNYIRFVVEAYAKRSTYTYNNVLATTSVGYWGALSPVLRPMFVEYTPPSNGQTSFLNTTAWTTGVYAYRAMIAGRTTYQYSIGGGGGGLNCIWYDTDTGLLFGLSNSQGLPAGEWMLSAYSINNPAAAVVNPPVKPSISMTLQQGIDSIDQSKSIDYYISFGTSLFDSVDLGIESTNQSVLTNANVTISANTYPITLNGNTPINITVTTRSTRYGLRSDSTTQVFSLIKLVRSSKIAATSSIGAVYTAGDESITIEWKPVVDASGYEVFVNGSYYDTVTTNITQYHPTENGSYVFTVITETNLPGYNSSDLSTTVTVAFATTAKPFNETYADVPMPIAETLNLWWLWALLIGTVVYVLLYILDIKAFGGKIGVANATATAGKSLKSAGQRTSEKAKSLSKKKPSAQKGVANKGSVKKGGK